MPTHKDKFELFAARAGQVGTSSKGDDARAYTTRSIEVEPESSLQSKVTGTQFQTAY